MAIFRSFHSGGRRTLGFLKSRNFRGGKDQEVQMASPSQISRRSVKQLVRYGDFSTSQDGCRPQTDLAFHNVEILGACRIKRVKMRYCAKIRGHRSKRCRDVLIFDLSKTAAVWHCSFEHIRASILCQFRLKCLVTPLLGAFRVEIGAT